MSTLLGILVVTVVVSNGVALALRAAASAWARQPIGNGLLTALLGVPYLMGASRSMRDLVPSAKRPRSRLALLCGVGGLVLIRGLLRMVFVRQVRRVRGRSTHTRGIGARGRAKVVDDPTFPAQAFFSPGREFEVVLRHATNFRLDDGAYDGRGAALSLVPKGGAEKGRRLDFLFNTGSSPVFWNAWSFFSFARGLGADPNAASASSMKAWLRDPRARAGIRAGFERAPSSFAHLCYYGQQTFRFEAADGAVHLARYRLRGGDAPRPNATRAADLAEPWRFEREANDLRPVDYLRQEYAERLTRGPVRYVLEIQLADSEGTERADLYDGSIPWNEAEHPWLSLAEVEISEPLTAGAEDQLRFNVGNAPESLGLFLPAGPSDPNSILWFRATMYAPAQRARSVYDRVDAVSPQERENDSQGSVAVAMNVKG